jgi:hypothetical protein
MCGINYFKGRYISADTVSYDLKNFVSTKSDNLKSKGINIILENGFLLGTCEGKVYLSSDGLLWNSVCNFNQNATSISIFKDEYYIFSDSGLAVKSRLLTNPPEKSHVTVECASNYSGLKEISEEPIIKNKILYLSCDTISEIINGICSYNKNKMSCLVSKSGRTVCIYPNSVNYKINGSNYKFKNKTIFSGEKIFVQADELLKILGYSFSYNDLNRRIKVKIT